MTSKTHIALGLLTASLIHKYYPQADNYDLITGVAIGSLLQDIDTKKSIMSQLLRPIAIVVDKLTRHRGFTHKILPFLLIAIYFITKMYDWRYSLNCLYVGVGGLTHFAIDVTTLKVGIKCNSRGEEILYVIFWVLTIALFVNSLWINYGNGLIGILNKIYLESGG